MNYGKIVAVLLLVIQFLNAGAYFVDLVVPEYTVLIAALAGGLQAFVRQIQSSGTN
jgi:hypothetical protein